MKPITDFILYWFMVGMLALRSLRKRVCQFYTNLFTKECNHSWDPTSSITRKRTGVYANCSRCPAQR